MTYSKLQYSRNLRKEINELEAQTCREAQKRIRNPDKEKLIQDTLQEARKQHYQTETEIRDWLQTAPLSSIMKKQILNYYIAGSSRIDDNFIRNVKYCFGLNKNWVSKEQETK